MKHCNVIVLANHGTVSFGTTPELAFWYTDILDAYCKVLLLAQPLGPLQYIPDDKCKELLTYKQEWGYSDLRIYGPDAGCNVCGHQSFRGHWKEANVDRRAFADRQETASANSNVSLSSADIERIAEKVVAKLKTQ